MNIFIDQVFMTLENSNENSFRTSIFTAKETLHQSEPVPTPEEEKFTCEVEIIDTK